jgi:hypothetical protein
MAFMDTPDFRTHKEGWMLLAGFAAGLQSDSDAWLPHPEERPFGRVSKDVPRASWFETAQVRLLTMRVDAVD